MSKDKDTVGKKVDKVQEGIAAFKELVAELHNWLNKNGAIVVYVLTALGISSGGVLLNKYLHLQTKVPHSTHTRIASTEHTPVAHPLVLQHTRTLHDGDHFTHINSFHDAMGYFCDVIETPNADMFIALDEINWGCDSQSDIYDKRLRKDFLALNDGSTHTRDFLLLSLAVQPVYDREVQKLLGPQLSHAYSESQLLRADLQGNNITITDSKLSILGCENFVVAKDERGIYHTAVVRFALAGNGKTTPMEGFYTESKEIGQHYEALFNSWKANERLMAPVETFKGETTAMGIEKTYTTDVKGNVQALVPAEVPPPP